MLSLKRKKVFSDCNNIYESYKKCINISQSIDSCDVLEFQLYNCFLHQFTKSEKINTNNKNQ